MNLDKAYELQRAMRESEEYTELMAAQVKIETDSTAKGLVERFISLQMQLEYAKMAEMKEKVDELNKEFEEVMPLIQANSGAEAYLKSYVKWTQVANDVYRIISEPITEGMKILDKAK